VFGVVEMDGGLGLWMDVFVCVDELVDGNVVGGELCKRVNKEYQGLGCLGDRHDEE